MIVFLYIMFFLKTLLVFYHKQRYGRLALTPRGKKSPIFLEVGEFKQILYDAIAELYRETVIPYLLE